MWIKCAQCGICCNPVAVWLSKESLLKRLANNGDETDRQFIELNWQKIEKPAVKLNRFMTDEVWDRLHFFKCDAFDEKTKLCTQYETRPVICREYPKVPRGQNSLKKQDLISDKCAFFEVVK